MVVALALLFLLLAKVSYLHQSSGRVFIVLSMLVW